MSNGTAEQIFEALGEPARRRIVEVLRAGPTPVGQLAGHLHMGRPGVSKHLKVLEGAGLITHRNVGTRHFYALVPDGTSVAQEWFTRMWDNALGAYAAEVEHVIDALKSTSREGDQ